MPTMIYYTYMPAVKISGQKWIFDGTSVKLVAEEIEEEIPEVEPYYD